MKTALGLLALVSCATAGKTNSMSVERAVIVNPESLEAKLTDAVIEFRIRLAPTTSVQVDSSLKRDHALRVKGLRDCTSHTPIPLFIPLFLEEPTATKILLDAGTEIAFVVRYPLSLPPAAHVLDCVEGTLTLCPEGTPPWPAIPFRANRGQAE